MDVRQLIGKQFRYQGKYGLSDWTDTVKDIVTQNEIVFDPPLTMKVIKGNESYKASECKIIGFKYKLFVVSEKSEQHYEFYDCIFKDEDND
jgi:hypothetical protein